jgi:hypothetical protein
VITVLRAEARLCLAADVERLTYLEDRLHEARISIGREMQSTEAMRRMRVEHWTRALHESSLEITAARNAGALSDALLEHAPRLGFRRVYLALHEEGGDRSHLLLGYDRDLPLMEVPEPPVFPTRLLTPADLRKRETPALWVLLPLQAGEERFGHLLLDAGPGEGLVWETLCEQVATALELCRALTASSV